MDKLLPGVDAAVAAVVLERARRQGEGVTLSR